MKHTFHCVVVKDGDLYAASAIENMYATQDNTLAGLKKTMSRMLAFQCGLDTNWRYDHLTKKAWDTGVVHYPGWNVPDFPVFARWTLVLDVKPVNFRKMKRRRRVA